MSSDEPLRSILYTDQDMSEGTFHAIASGTAGVFSARCPDKQSSNEDAAALIPVDEKRAILAIADGFGGQPAGDQAARLTVDALNKATRKTRNGQSDLRGEILNGFETANRAVCDIGVGAATTLALAEIYADTVRPYHVGDSVILVLGQRGKVKLQTLCHSPVGYAVEAGVLEEREAIHHEDRHLVSNMLGSPDMSIDVGSAVKLSPRDTVLLASDGLLDNLHLDEIVQIARKGPLEDVVRKLAEQCLRRMRTPDSSYPSKPDDLTFIAFRLHA